jgi:hypothetical protein
MRSWGVVERWEEGAAGQGRQRGRGSRGEGETQGKGKKSTPHTPSPLLPPALCLNLIEIDNFHDQE